MLNTKSMYEEYVSDLTKEKDSLFDRSDKLHKTLKYIEQQLKNSRTFIRNHSSIHYEELLLINDERKVRLLEFIKVTGSGRGKRVCTPYEIDSVKRTLVNRIQTQKKLMLIRKRLLEIKAQILPYKEFRFIIDEFNTGLADEIIKGYEFNPGHYIGNMRVRKKPRSGKNVNWGESNKKKAEILSRGGTPLNKETAPDGEAWLVYFTDDFGYWFYWAKGKCRLKNKSIFSFKPAWGWTKDLAAFRKHNKFAELNYRE